MNPQEKIQKCATFQQLQEKYQISQYGFLYGDCVFQLPEQFKQFQILKDSLPQTKCSNFGQIADSLIYDAQKYSFKNMKLSNKQLKFMYAFLTLCYSRYIWENGVKNPRKQIPQIIAMPFLEICQIINIKPSIAYASQIIYNWNFKNNTKQINIQNLYCPMTMSGTRAEQWFYLIMIAMEIICGDIIVDMYNAHHLSDDKLLVLLKNIRKHLIQMKSIIKRMYEENPLNQYNDKVRQYLMGTKNIPGGVTVKGTDIKICQTGGSAAQSPIIQAISLFLRVQLQETSKQFIQRNKLFMPKVQRQFLSDLQAMPNIKQKIKKSQNMKMIQAFNFCIEALHQLRGAHFGVVDHYVFKHLKDQKALGTGSSHAKHFLSSMMKQTSFGKIVLNQQTQIKTQKTQMQIEKTTNKKTNKTKTKGIIIFLIILVFLILSGVYFFSSSENSNIRLRDQLKRIQQMFIQSQAQKSEL